jgi:hypothetical protein
MATALTGRYLQIEMLPLSLDETMKWNNIDIHAPQAQQLAKAAVLADDYMRNGGYPETIKASHIYSSTFLASTTS